MKFPVTVVVLFEAALNVPPFMVRVAIDVLAVGLKVPPVKFTVIKLYNEGPFGVNTSPESITSEPEVNVNAVGTKLKSVALSGFNACEAEKFATSARSPAPVSYHSLNAFIDPAVFVNV